MVSGDGVMTGGRRSVHDWLLLDMHYELFIPISISTHILGFILYIQHTEYFHIVSLPCLALYIMDIFLI